MVSNRVLLLALLFGVPVEWTRADDGIALTEESLLQEIREIRDFLEQHEVRSVESLHEQVFGMGGILRDTRSQNKKMEKTMSKLNGQARLAVGHQIGHLVSRLEDTHRKVLALRSSSNDSQLVSDEDAAVVTEEEAVPEYVAMRDLKRKFETRKILEPSEKELHQWMEGLIAEEIEIYKANLLQDFGGDEEDDDEEEEEENCVSVNEAVQKVQAAVSEYSQDGIGLIDHAQGSEIVHSMTSLTYEPPAEYYETLGTVWWRKYIPEDWEGLLPHGWEEWNTAIPSIFYHSFNIGGAKVSPPKSVIQKKTLPGSCWPMDGNRGQFTLRLPYPMYIDKFTLDHVSSLIVSEDMQESAPKQLKVIGYPPCEEEDCMALGFDVSDPMEIGFINYDADGPSVQTFESIFSQSLAPEPDVELEDDAGVLGYEDEDAEEGGCAAAGATACSTPPSVPFAGITVKVLKNYGHPDYTCIYRFRVHGTPDYA